MSRAEGGLSDANSEGAPAGAAGGTAIEVAVGKRVRQQTEKVKAALTGAQRSKKARLKKTGSAGCAAAPTQRGTAGGGAALPLAPGAGGAGTAGGGAALPQAPGAGGATPVAGNSDLVVTPGDAPITKCVSVATAQLPCDPASSPAVESGARQSMDDSAHENTAADGMAAADKYVSPAKKFWSGGQGIRLVLCALEDCMVGPMERLGTQSDRLETQVSCAGNPQGPDDHFFEVLTEVYNNDQFHAVIPWADEHFTAGAMFKLEGRRDATYLRQQWAKMSAKFEVAFQRFNRSGMNDQCFCQCGATGFYSCTGWTTAWGECEKLRTPAVGNKAWHPPADKTVWVFFKAGEFSPSFRAKSSKVLPQSVRRTGNVKGLGGVGVAKGAEKGRKGKTQHDQLESTFRDEGGGGGGRSSKKEHVIYEVLDMLKKDIGESARAQTLRRLHVQQNTIEATLSTLLSRREKLMGLIKDVDSGEDAEDIQEELDEINGRRKGLRKTAVALDAEIQEERAAVERERSDAAQSVRRERNRARMLQMDEGDDNLGFFPDSTSPQGQSSKEGKEGSQEEGEEDSQEEGEEYSQEDAF
jgi:hypothetical protein